MVTDNTDLLYDQQDKNYVELKLDLHCLLGLICPSDYTKHIKTANRKTF